MLSFLQLVKQHTTVFNDDGDNNEKKNDNHEINNKNSNKNNNVKNNNNNNNNNNNFIIDKANIKAVYIAPMKALAQEIVAKFSERLAPLGMIVREYTGFIFIFFIIYFYYYVGF
jgi:hypothetical protein